MIASQAEYKLKQLQSTFYRNLIENMDGLKNNRSRPCKKMIENKICPSDVQWVRNEVNIKTPEVQAAIVHSSLHVFKRKIHFNY